MKLIVTGSIAFDYLMSFPGQVHRALAARAHAAGQPQLPRRHDGQAARRLRAEHRLHAGAARRAAAPDGHGGAGLRRLRGVAGRPPASTLSLVKVVADKFTASFFCSTDQAQQPDRVVLHRRHGQRRRAVVPRRRRAAADGAGRSSRRTTPTRWSSTPRSAARMGVQLHLGSGPAVRADGRRAAARTASIGAFMVICNDYEFELIRQKTGHERGRTCWRRRRCWSSPGASTAAT